jgi:hypothetical protein
VCRSTPGLIFYCAVVTGAWELNLKRRTWVRLLRREPAGSCLDRRGDLGVVGEVEGYDDVGVRSVGGDLGGEPPWGGWQA